MDSMVPLPIWLIVLGAIAITGLVIWFVISVLAVLFTLTGPPDAFDVDITESKEK